MRCENCKHCKTEEINVTQHSVGRMYTMVYRCGASPSGKRKIGSVYNGICTYNHKIIYSPDWCPVTKEQQAKLERGETP